jgi:NCS2 family nucleobase:cation symporter-2
MARPSDLIYAVDDPVPVRVLVLAGLQHTALILGVGISLPLLVLSKGQVDAETTRTLLSMGLVALAVATVLQIQRRGLLGSGFFAPATFTAAYLPPCVSAIQQGGLPLVMGMLIFGGLLQMALAPAMQRLRAYLPPEIGGLAVVMIGIILGFLGFQLITEAPEWTLKPGALLAPAWLGALTMAVIIALGVWGKGGWRVYATLIGLITGSAFAFLTGAVEPLHFFRDTVEQALRAAR